MNPEQTYHVAKDGQTLGPYSAETIQQYLNEGRLSQADHLFNAETQEWVALSAVGFQAQVQTAPPLPPPLSDEHQDFVEDEDASSINIAAVLQLMISLALLGFLFYQFGPTHWFQIQDRVAKKLYNASSQEQIEDLTKQFVVGTWTYTGKDPVFNGSVMWLRLVIHGDGRIESSTAFPAMDGWPAPTHYRWKCSTGKFGDTGERWYGIKCEPTPNTVGELIIRKDGTLECRNPAMKRFVLKRGDASPFSR